jgi:hypothetical protein
VKSQIVDASTRSVGTIVSLLVQEYKNEMKMRKKKYIGKYLLGQRLITIYNLPGWGTQVRFLRIEVYKSRGLLVSINNYRISNWSQKGSSLDKNSSSRDVPWELSLASNTLSYEELLDSGNVGR